MPAFAIDLGRDIDRARRPIPEARPPKPAEAAPEPAQAATHVTFKIKSNHDKVVRLQVYFQDRKRVWPSADTYRSLEDYDFHTYRVSCNAGERICVGAWTPSGRQWGVGEDNKYSCSNCCTACDADTFTFIVN
jgi:hypothetical protein